jgi:prepilin-type processing-associated H-X9-DG protein/prepilin-type N-terminal cleavage/methylation domain-containing protein
VQTRPAKLSCPLRRRGFTLVEILVTIGCIAILASLLFGVTTRTKETAKSLKCSSNLRQIGVAALAWSADNEGKIVSTYEDFENQRTWAYKLAPYLDASLPDSYNADTYNAASAPAVLKMPVLRCPNQAVEMNWPGYGYNSDHLSLYRTSGSPKRWVRYNQVQHPSRTVMITDHAQLVNKTRWVPFVRSPAGPKDAVVDFRHAGKTANVLWVDGHVSAEKADGDLMNTDNRNWKID